jgi:hypothetical protein
LAECWPPQGGILDDAAEKQKLYLVNWAIFCKNVLIPWVENKLAQSLNKKKPDTGIEEFYKLVSHFIVYNGISHWEQLAENSEQSPLVSDYLLEKVKNKIRDDGSWKNLGINYAWEQSETIAQVIKENEKFGKLALGGTVWVKLEL